jgi:hypothetical protein
MVHAPPHYTRLDPEPREVLHGWRPSYPVGCAIKYLARLGQKVLPGETAKEAALRDLDKCAEYVAMERRWWEEQP